MSASNWGICPRCMRKVEQAQTDLLNRVETDYGKVSADEYRELIERSSRPREEEETMLREDWEISIWDDEFCVHYSASCEKCGFSHKFKHTEKVT